MGLQQASGRALGVPVSSGEQGLGACVVRRLARQAGARRVGGELGDGTAQGRGDGLAQRGG
ncbi:hypothetical protein [Kitasatospora sp. DSM 101779]|uniref:hypothetical protein n=1 Tax=Kitasatospora sp. DSM 101779 TaxID=2853165 RepID=UPI0021DB76B6|nr:hypothetical protein [Kitasatospora sp. DSM 101779]MCU7827184.1 hypothetical protein [Kitasatospora sp. DSM 101779]